MGLPKRHKKHHPLKLNMRLNYELNGRIVKMKINDILTRELKDPKFAEAYHADKEKSASALALYHTREEAGLTQADLAERANVPQSTIARIERGDNVTFDKLAEIAHAMGKTIKIEFTQ
nr:DNA-binding helix-turn-helix transcriptional regulator [Lactiplantibacillus plantarum]